MIHTSPHHAACFDEDCTLPECVEWRNRQFERAQKMGRDMADAVDSYIAESQILDRDKFKSNIVDPFRKRLGDIYDDTLRNIYTKDFLK